ncbi:MAG TPA: hypothetical protein VF369_04625, partial [candidate division Zixibacteria bacterium]
MYLFCFSIIFLPSIQAQTDSPEKIAPPFDLKVKDTSNDGGGSLSLSWQLSPQDKETIGDIDGYEIFRTSKSDTTFRLIARVL